MPGKLLDRSCLLLLCMLLIAARQGAAQAGQLDPSFGNGGIVTTDFGDQNSSQNSASANAVAIQPDGKIVVVGAAPGANNFPIAAVARYNTNGTLDTTFGSSGIVTTSSIEAKPFTSVALQPNGAIVAVAGGFTASIARYTSAGALDSTFGTGGIVTLNDINGPSASGVVILSDGNILVANHNLFRLLSTGQLDTSFGNGGTASTPGYSATTLALLSNGEIQTASSESASGFIAQFEANGALDTTFGISGQLATPGTAAGLIPLATGDFLAGGTLTNSASRGNGGIPASGFTISRYLPAGVTEASFGTNGGTSSPVPNYLTVATSGIAIQASGDIVFVGTASQSATTAIALARYTPSGQLDTTFGTNGTVVTAFGSGITNATVSGNGLAIQSDSKIVVVASYGVSVPRHGFDTAFKVIRYLGQ
jgi:uncharacterized delta-60 repeat protein